jgi:hypothetical protein
VQIPAAVYLVFSEKGSAETRRLLLLSMQALDLQGEYSEVQHYRKKLPDIYFGIFRQEVCGTCKFGLLFMQATKAYLAGQKGLAKELGARGREQSELMKAAHVVASQAIYKHRNPVSGIPEK